MWRLRMEIVVCVKQVPEVGDVQLSIAESGRDIRRNDLVLDINEWDNYALEEGLLLKEEQGGTLTVVTLGPESSEDTLRACLAKGADRAIRLGDDTFAGSDASSIAKILSKAIQSIKFDLLLTGAQASDDGYAQVGVALAQLLKIPHAALVKNLKVKGDYLRVSRELEGGVREILELKLPAAITVQTGINEPRYASIIGIRKAMGRQIEIQNADSLGLKQEEIGEEGSDTKLEKLFLPPSGKRAQILPGTTKEISEQLGKIFKDKGVIS